MNKNNEGDDEEEGGDDDDELMTVTKMMARGFSIIFIGALVYFTFMKPSSYKKVAIALKLYYPNKMYYKYSSCVKCSMFHKNWK